MDKKGLILVSRNAHEMLVNALTEYVRENGEEMSDYFYDEHGIDEEDEEGVKVVKVLDVSESGCHFACQHSVNREDSCVDDRFYHYAIWSLYIVREADGTERLKYYMFHSDGIEYEEDSEPDHDYVSSLTIADLHYVYEAVIKM